MLFPKSQLPSDYIHLLIDFILDDSEGQMDKLEHFLGKTQGVGQFEVVTMSRRSVQIK